jgi:hypothetical protein
MGRAIELGTGAGPSILAADSSTAAVVVEELRRPAWTVLGSQEFTETVLNPEKTALPPEFVVIVALLSGPGP